MKYLRYTASLVAATIVAATSAQSESLAPPDWHDSPLARFAEWQSFPVAFGGEGNPADTEGSHADARLIQTTPGAIITGSGNIYHPGGVSAFQVTVEPGVPSETVVFQARALGDLDPESMVLEYEQNDSRHSLPAPAEEVSRKSGGFGDSVVYRWIWDLSARDVTVFALKFNAAAAHFSLDAARLDWQLKPSAPAINADIDAPDRDRWNYPYNATPGTRARASMFRSIDDEVGIYRYGGYIVSFDTSAAVPTGLEPSAYLVTSVSVQLMTSDNFKVPYDSSYDPAQTYLPETDDRRVPDTDSGRPINLFGAGFRNGFDLTTWEETTVYRSKDSELTTVYPMVLNDSGEVVDVTLAVDYDQPSDPAPLATGALDGIEPGELIPFNAWMNFDLALSNPGTLAYVQQGLSQGRIVLYATSLNGGSSTDRTYPEFHTSDSLLGEAPRLRIQVVLTEGKSISGPALRLTRSAAGMELQFRNPLASPPQIYWTSDFETWHQVISPAIETLPDGRSRWTDTDTKATHKFYRLIVP